MAKKKSRKKPPLKTSLPISENLTREVAALNDSNEIADMPAIQVTCAEARIVRLKADHPDLYDRCRNKIGMSDVQIGCYPDAKSLLDYANKIHPGSMAIVRVKEGVKPEPVKFEDNIQDSYTLESVLEAKFIKTNRDHFDRGNLQGLLRRINRKYGQHDPVRIVTDQSFKVVKRELVTKYTIYYK